jgi:plasmid stabilization system protein ParE
MKPSLASPSAETGTDTVELGDDVRAIALAHYPYRIFYRIGPNAVEILHVRHTSRSPWEGGR